MGKNAQCSICTEIIVILGEHLQQCNDGLRTLPPVSEMIEDDATNKNRKNLIKYYTLSSQKGLLEKIKRDVNKIIRRESKNA